MKKIQHRVGSIFASVVVLAGLMIAPVAAQQTGGIGGRPANPREDNSRTQSIFIHEIRGGESVDDAVLISNGTDEERTIELYAVDGVVTNTGAYTCRQKTEEIQDSAAWITLARGEVTLPSGGSEEIPFTINAPDNADVGEHNACLVFADLNDEGRVTGGVRIQTRQAVRVVTTVPGDLHREINLDSFNATDKLFSLSASNRGNVSADVQASITVKNIFGSTVQREEGQYPVLPNEKLDLTFDKTKESPWFENYFWGGWYRASAVVAYNNEAGRFGFDVNEPTTIRESGVEYIFVTPSTVALVMYGVAILLIIGLILLVILSSRRHKNRVRHTLEYVVVAGDTIDSLARHYDVSWKHIAKINRLTAPYILKPGETIRVPNKQIKQKQIRRRK